MNRRMPWIFVGVVAALFVFLFAPALVRTAYRRVTPAEEIEALSRRYWLLDAAEAELPSSQKEAFTRRRVAISEWLSMRGVDIDRGLRDEAVEHAAFVLRLYGMTRWEWSDMLHYWRSHNDLKNPELLRASLQ